MSIHRLQFRPPHCAAGRRRGCVRGHSTLSRLILALVIARPERPWQSPALERFEIGGSACCPVCKSIFHLSPEQALEANDRRTALTFRSWMRAGVG